MPRRAQIEGAHIHYTRGVVNTVPHRLFVQWLLGHAPPCRRCHARSSGRTAATRRYVGYELRHIAHSAPHYRGLLPNCRRGWQHPSEYGLQVLKILVFSCVVRPGLWMTYTSSCSSSGHISFAPDFYNFVSDFRYTAAIEWRYQFCSLRSLTWCSAWGASPKHYLISSELLASENFNFLTSINRPLRGDSITLLKF
jgi:hypothetical protein